jgi:hypothetical protein
MGEFPIQVGEFTPQSNINTYYWQDAGEQTDKKGN